MGRNCTLFDSGRKWAYKQVLKYRLTGDREEFFEAVRCALEDMNDFPDPLPNSEVKQIAKSISKWTWKNYTARWTDEKFSEIQAKRGRLGGLKNGVANYEKREQAKEMRATGMTLQAIADKLEVGKGTISKWLKK